ncbi:hypothetical protein TanjilG_13612 [Lupinus angustifolius]|uniref:FHA domain-containing protein n=1 Tax=Lupinus angustifolius TaxID=3871 RepID=A0A1J7GR11_LUPAN|nr:PREDICTED: uncharacterized protein LOC109358775 [Lupinus angustifolius]OIW02975.1 hypothetical protein TanjilG_13612 [Lupinus angustifolius]
METLMQLQSLVLVKTPKSKPYFSAFLSKPSLLFYNNATSASAFSSLSIGCVRSKAKVHQNLGLGAIHASSEVANQTTNAAPTWILEPVGDGDTKHIGFKVEMPGAYEIASSDVTVGRVPDKADLVIPVATVSGAHARIQKKQGSLLVTDLDSTNGTFVDEKRLRPGVVATVSAGSFITFGDTHLAMFRVSKVEKVESADTIQETQSGLDTDIKSDNNTQTN